MADIQESFSTKDSHDRNDRDLRAPYWTDINSTDDVLEPTLNSLQLITRHLTARFSSVSIQRCLVTPVDEVSKTLLAEIVRLIDGNIHVRAPFLRPVLEGDFGRFWD